MRRYDYDWEAPGATALVAVLEEAERVIGRFRRASTPSGSAGMPAHATVLPSFVHAGDLRDNDVETIAQLIGRVAPFDVELARFGRFEEIGVLYLAPEPRETFVELSQALWDAYPEVPFLPEGAQEIVPHVTVASRLPRAELDAIEAELRPELPLRERVERVVLFERGGNGRWAAHAAFPLSA